MTIKVRGPPWIFFQYLILPIPGKKWIHSILTHHLLRLSSTTLHSTQLYYFFTIYFCCKWKINTWFVTGFCTNQPNYLKWNSATNSILYLRYEEIFKTYNMPHKPVRVFTYLIGREISDLKAANWMACQNRGKFSS